MAETSASTIVRNAAVARAFADDVFGDMTDGDTSDLDHCVKMVGDQCAAVRNGNLDHATDMLAAQMVTLDTLFTDYVKRAGTNAGTYPQAFERYMNLALKAQARCQATAESLAKIKRGGKQTVKVVHVHEGGQAVVADTVNNGMGGKTGADVGNSEQCHEQAADALVAALPGPDETRDGVPLPSLERKEKVPLTRRTRRSAEG